MNAISGSYDAQDRLLRFGDYTYSYTPTGTLLSKQKTDGSEQTQYTYDDLGQLSKVRLPDGKVVEYSIDPLVRRAVKKVNGVVTQKYAYQGAQLVAVLNPDNTVKSRFIYATESHSPDYMIQAGASYRLIKDHLGSIRMVVNASAGVVAQQLDYDEFGKVISDSNPSFQPFGFAGGLYDSDIKLVRFGARDYDAEIGRWTAKDPIGFEGGDTNLYEYTMSDPMNFIDPSGLKIGYRSEQARRMLAPLIQVIKNSSMAGLDLVTRLENCGKTYELGVNTEDVNGMLKDGSISVDPYSQLRILTDSTTPVQNATMLRVLVHELGHLTGKGDSPNPGNRMENVNAWENPIMYPIEGIKRLAY